MKGLGSVDEILNVDASPSNLKRKIGEGEFGNVIGYFFCLFLCLFVVLFFVFSRCGVFGICYGIIIRKKRKENDEPMVLDPTKQEQQFTNANSTAREFFRQFSSFDTDGFAPNLLDDVNLFDVTRDGQAKSIGMKKLVTQSDHSPTRPTTILSTQSQTRQNNLRRLFVNRFLRGPTGSATQFLAEIKAFVGRTESREEKRQLITALLKETAMYQDIRIATILQDLLK
jgi:hypothetical protein